VVHHVAVLRCCTALGPTGEVTRPRFRFSGVTVTQVLRHYQRVDGCRSAPVVTTGCRRCLIAAVSFRQVILWQADPDPAGRLGL
jgi:hypothetical protein